MLHGNRTEWKWVLGRTALGLGLLMLPLSASATTFMLGEWRGADGVYTWSGGTANLLYTHRSNDTDLNVSEGSSPNIAWYAEHHTDKIGRYQIGLGDLGTQPFPSAYPKHITVFNDRVYVSERNKHEIWEYHVSGSFIRAVDLGTIYAQGMATDGTSLFLSTWNFDTGVQQFERYDANLVLQEIVAAPTGLGPYGPNIFDFAYDPSNGEFVGLVDPTGERGTSTRSSTLVRFQMGGAVLSSSTIGFEADSIGQYNIPEPAVAILLGAAAVAFNRQRRSAAGPA